MSDNFNCCGTMQLHQEMLQRREARIAAGDTKLAELSNAADVALKAYDAFHRATISEQTHQDDPLAWLHASLQYAALEAAGKALHKYEAELNDADEKRLVEIEKKLAALNADAAENGLSEEANAEMDALELEQRKLEFPWF